MHRVLLQANTVKYCKPQKNRDVFLHFSAGITMFLKLQIKYGTLPVNIAFKLNFPVVFCISSKDSFATLFTVPLMFRSCKKQFCTYIDFF